MDTGASAMYREIVRSLAWPQYKMKMSLARVAGTLDSNNLDLLCVCLRKYQEEDSFYQQILDLAEDLRGCDVATTDT